MTIDQAEADKRLLRRIRQEAMDYVRMPYVPMPGIDALHKRIAELEAAIESVSFHYWNCLGDCPKFKPEMAKLAALIKYDDGCGNEYLSETTK